MNISRRKQEKAVAGVSRDETAGVTVVTGREWCASQVLAGRLTRTITPKTIFEMRWEEGNSSISRAD